MSRISSGVTPKVQILSSATPGNRGFSLIECLVALLILSVGLLGVSKMVGHSLQFADTAMIRTQSIVLAYSIADKIRANELSADDYEIDFADEIANPPDCGANTCTAQQLAQADIAEWKDQMAVLLPVGEGRNVVTADDVTISIRWDDRGTAGTFDLVITR
jgi:type IV pilus assembly protein PilV